MTTVKVNFQDTHTFTTAWWAEYDESEDVWKFYAIVKGDDGGLFHYPAHEDEDDPVELEVFDREEIVSELGITGTDWDELTPRDRTRMIALVRGDDA